jgi:hypothetical protein
MRTRSHAEKRGGGRAVWEEGTRGQKQNTRKRARERELTPQLNVVQVSGGAQAANVNFHLTLGLHPDPRKTKYSASDS